MRGHDIGGYYQCLMYEELCTLTLVWVRKIFAMVADGKSLYEVAKYLERVGAPSLVVDSGTDSPFGT
jgi:hypothetical protein